VTGDPARERASVYDDLRRLEPSHNITNDEVGHITLTWQSAGHRCASRWQVRSRRHKCDGNSEHLNGVGGGRSIYKNLH